VGETLGLDASATKHGACYGLLSHLLLLLGQCICVIPSKKDEDAQRARHAEMLQLYMSGARASAAVSAVYPVDASHLDCCTDLIMNLPLWSYL